MGSPEVFLLSISRPGFLSDNVHYVHTDRFYPATAREVYKANEFENFWDTMNKLRWALNNLSDFLWVYDDVVMLREADYEELTQPWYLWEISGEWRKKVMEAKSRWGETIKEAYKILFINQSNYTYNFEHHFPIHYSNHPAYKEIIEHLITLPIPAAPHTVLLNSRSLMPLAAKQLGGMRQNHGCMFYGIQREYDNLLRFPSNTLQQVEKAAEGKLWMNYNDQGVNINGRNQTSGIKEYLVHNFPNKSCYEK